MRIVAQLVSVVFHPLLIVSYMLILLLLINPFLLGVRAIGEQRAVLFLLQVILSTFFLPLVATLMLKFVGLAPSIQLNQREDRYIPYIITGAFYTWVTVNFIRNPEVPTPFACFLLGATIALFLSFFINLFSKISAHTVGMGGLIGMVSITMMLFSYGSFALPVPLLGAVEVSLSSLLMAVIVLAGLVGTCRFLLNAHDPMDIYGGYIVGFSAQFIALRFMWL